MGFSRYEAKMRAKVSMRGAVPHPLLVSLVYFLATSGVSLVAGLLLSGGSLVEYYRTFLAYVAAGYDPILVLQHLQFFGIWFSLYLFVNIVIALYTAVMQMGYLSYSLRLARNQRPGYRNLLDGFSMAGRAILTAVLRWIFTVLWTLLGLVPYMVVAILGIVTLSGVLIGVAMVLLVAGMIFGVAMSYRYRLACYFLLDQPGMGALAAVTASKNAMQGWKWSLFVLDLSFLGWLILSLFTLNILMLWLTPYMCATEANFYDFAVHGDYSAPDFRRDLYGRPNGPDTRPGF